MPQELETYLDELAECEDMDTETAAVFREYVLRRWPDKSPDDPFLKKWAKRFGNGVSVAYGMSDHEGRLIIKQICGPRYLR